MKKLILLLLMAGCCLMTANAQKTVVSQTDQKVFDTVEQMPEYPGGMQAMKSQAATRATKGVVNFVKEHPDEAKKAGKAAVNYAKENPEVLRSAASTAASAGSAVL